MSRFVIEPHFRLQEWVAVEKDYFRDEGLEYEFRELIRSEAWSSGAPGAPRTSQCLLPLRVGATSQSVICASYGTISALPAPRAP